MYEMNVNKLEELPVIDINTNSFMDLDSEFYNNLINIIGKNIVYRRNLEEGIIECTGKLVDYKEEILFIENYDIVEQIKITDIKSLEQIKENNILLSNDLIGKICEITNVHNDKIIGIISNIETTDNELNDEVEIQIKIIEDNEEFIIPIYYFKKLIKQVTVI